MKDISQLWCMAQNGLYYLVKRREVKGKRMFLQDKVKDIDRRFEKLTDLSTIIVWGAGAHTAKIFEETSLLSHGITGIVDMNREKWGKLYFGFQVENPENIVWADVDAVIICAFDKDSVKCYTKVVTGVANEI